ncbi:MAG: ribosome-associated translation inhibitor RaiA [Candidatus Magasanikbacteria bacterium]|nr:ribosome-associated translation inhibitor RaiA [Candidatus Magasanikbacteria bacterium]
MQITFHSTGLTLTNAIKEIAAEKYARLDKIVGTLHDNPLVTVELSRTTHHHHKGKIFRAEVHMAMGRQSVYAAAESDDLYDSMDQSVAAIKKQILRIKESAVDNRKRDK